MDILAHLKIMCMKECLRDKHYASDEKVKTAVMKWLKNSQQNFTRQKYMLLFEGGTLLLRETVTILRNSDVIHKGPASFWYMIHDPMSIIIPVLKKKELLFDTPF